MADTTLPDEKRPIKIDLKNLDLVPGTWIISAFLKGINNETISSLEINDAKKGVNSFDISIYINYFDAYAYPLIVDYVFYILNGGQNPSENRHAYLILEPFQRIFTHLAKNRNRAMGVKVDGKEILYLTMNPGVRDKLLSEDKKELDFDRNKDDRRKY